MADSVFRAPDDGAVRMPSVDAAMNKVAPTNMGGGKGAKDDKANTRLGSDSPEAQKLLERARKRFDQAVQAEAENRRAALDDLNFYRGNQWPADIAAQRNFDNRPCLTINKLPTFVLQVTNDVRQNRPEINVSPVGDRSDPEVAKMYSGLIREIERKSVADIAYDTAFAGAARAGFGYWRVMTEYEKPKSFHQVITIQRIRNPFTVYLDPMHQAPEGSDAKWAFISEMVNRAEFRDDYPDAQPMTWTQGGVGDSMKSWITQDQLRIAEYYEFETEKRTLVRLSSGAVGWRDEIAEEEFERFEVLEERESDWSRLWWYKITGVEVLEERRVPGIWIPIVKVGGDEVDVEGKVYLNGIVRHAKDAQRMYNYWVTMETELVALAPKAPFIGAEGQFEGHEQAWKTANTKSNPYLEYKPETIDGQLLPPPQRQQLVQIPVGVVNAKQGAAQDMMATTGIRFDATTKDRMYDESGRALRELRKFGDLGSFHLVDNLARALRHTGVILVDMIPRIYNVRRVETILRENDAEERVVIDPGAGSPMSEVRDPQTQKIMKVFNPTIGEYGVTVTIGPSYATKRVEAAESMMDFARALPQAAALIMDLIAKNQDWPGADEMATRLAKALPPGLLSPDMKDVSPQLQALIASMQQQLQQAQQERVLLMKALTDQQADRDQRERKIELDFEAKVLSAMQKAEANFNTHIGAQLKELGQAVHALHESLTVPESARVQ
jgi:Skp family chaperone for outer membrane proteins